MSQSITAPGAYDGIPETEYQSDALIGPPLAARPMSYSSAKTILSHPARFAWEREHRRPGKREFDMGSLVHALLLRSGDDRLHVVDAYNWRTKAAQKSRDEAQGQGKIAVHRGMLRDAARVAAAARRDPRVAQILSDGRPEVSIYWVDEETGVTCRARIDWLNPTDVVDVKTVGSYSKADPKPFGRSAASFDYPMQAAVYTEGVERATGVRRGFATIAVELDPPHFVHVTRYPEWAVLAGEARWRRALAIYAEREKSGQWADEGITTTPVPEWYGYDEIDTPEIEV